MKANADALRRDELRWPTPLPLWAGILTGPVAWALNLTISYALVHWTCVSGRGTLLHLMTVTALVIVGGGATVSLMALRHSPDDAPTDGGEPQQRARFMAILGLASAALFGLQILASAIPWWVLDACH